MKENTNVPESGLRETEPTATAENTSELSNPNEEQTKTEEAPKLELVDCQPCGGTGSIRLKEDELDIGTETPCRDCEGEGKVPDRQQMPPPSTLHVRYDSGKQVTLHGWFTMIQWPLGKLVHCMEPKATLLNFDKIESVETQLYAPPEVSKIVRLPKKSIKLTRQ